jgi:hypothetical protein
VKRLRIAAAACLAVTGYVHADLYIHGYRVIPFIGPAFLVQASGSFAVALLLIVGGAVTDEPLALRLAAAALAAGALAGFVASRTVGVFGFVERGLQPYPQALLSVLAEAGVLLLLAAAAVTRRRAAGNVVSLRVPARLRGRATR